MSSDLNKSEFTGRIVKDAVLRRVATKNGERDVISFSLAVHNSYTPKDSKEKVKQTMFINISYWNRPGIAPYLTKGRMIHVEGELKEPSVHDGKAYTNVTATNIRFFQQTVKSMQDNGTFENSSEPAVDDTIPF